MSTFKKRGRTLEQIGNSNYFQRCVIAGVITLMPSVAMPFSSWQIAPEITVSEVYDSVNNHSTQLLPKSGWTTEVNPKIHGQASGTRVKGYFDFSITSIIYSSQSEFNNNQRELDALATVEAVENWLFVDVGAARIPTKTSIFGAGSSSLASGSTNRTETTVYRVAPYIRGVISDIASYQLRLNATDARANDDSFSNTKATEWVGRINTASPSAKLGWSLNGSAASVRNSLIGKKEDNRIFGTLIHEVIPSLHVSAGTGTESTDFAGSSKQSNSTPGLGVEWSPSALAQFAAVREKRFFGYGHSYTAGYRTRLLAFGYRDNKDVSLLPNVLVTSGNGSIFRLMSDLLTASIPDPLERERAVKQNLDATGIAPIISAGSAVLTSRPVLDRTREASVALIGVTNTATLIFSQSDQTGLASNPSATDNFSLSNEIRVKTISASWRHDLTALSSLTLVTSYTENEGLSVANLVTKDHSAGLLFTTKLGPKTSLSAGYRLSRFDSTTTGKYRENAVLGSFNHRF